MKRLVQKWVWVLAAVMLVDGCRAGKASAPGGTTPRTALASEPVHLTLVATNDVHGWVQPHVSKTTKGQPLEQGGLVAFGGYVQILREENPGGVMLFDAGDFFQGTMVSNFTEGAAVIDAYNALGYTAVALGNHEFDYGPMGTASVPKSAEDDPFGALKARIQQARFPMLARNVYEEASGERPAWLPSAGLTMVTVKGVTIGIVGLLTPSTPTVTNPVNVASLRFGSLVPEMAESAQTIRSKGADVVIALVHAGGGCKQLEDPKDTASCDLSTGEIFEALEALPPRTFDAVIAGHTHQGIAHFIRGTPVVQSFGMARHFATIDLFVEPRTRKILPEKTVIRPAIPICMKVDASSRNCDPAQLKDAQKLEWVPATFMGKTVEADRQVEGPLKAALSQVEAVYSKSLGLRSPVALTRNYHDESPLGNVLADSLRDMQKADLALLNPGGLRSDLRAGDLTYGDLFEVLPFDDGIARVTVTEKELEKLLHAAFEGRKGVFQSSGLNLTLTKCEGKNRLRQYALVDAPSRRKKNLYVVAMSDFLARGGDGLGPVLASLPKDRVEYSVSQDGSLRDAMMRFWQSRKNKELKAAPKGRVRFVDEPSVCGNSEAVGP